ELLCDSSRCHRPILLLQKSKVLLLGNSRLQLIKMSVSNQNVLFARSAGTLLIFVLCCIVDGALAADILLFDPPSPSLAFPSHEKRLQDVLF
uniref:Uncharacterized protein n=1 Tax=Oryzias latipes TaxID=8090 RepID=A0A3P9M2R4_ORYLA